MRTFISAIIALIAAIFLGSGVLLVAAFGVCAFVLADSGSKTVIGIGVVVGIIGALVFSVWVFVSVFKSLDKSSHSNGEQGKPPVPPHYYRNRAQQRESDNNENQE